MGMRLFCVGVCALALVWCTMGKVEYGLIVGNWVVIFCVNYLRGGVRYLFLLVCVLMCVVAVASIWPSKHNG